jgi:hypothetical protein
MEFIPGAESLVQSCERRRVPLRSRLELLIDVCEAVAHGQKDAALDEAALRAACAVERHPLLLPRRPRTRQAR